MSPSGAACCACPLLPLLYGAEPVLCPAAWHMCPDQGRHHCPVSLRAPPLLQWPHAGRLWVAPAPLLQPLGSGCPSPSGRSAMRRQSSGRSRRRGQRSGSSGGPGLVPCTTAPLHTRMVSGGLGTGTLGPCGFDSSGGNWASLCQSSNLAQPCLVGSCCHHWAVLGTDGVPWLFPASVGLGVSCASQSLFHSETCLGGSPGCLSMPWPHCQVCSSREEPLPPGAVELHEVSASSGWGLCCGVSSCPPAGWGQCLAPPGPA